MRLPDLDELTYPGDDVTEVVVPSLDGEARVEFRRTEDDPTGVDVVFVYDFPFDAGTLRAPVDVDEGTVEKLYRLFRASVVDQLRNVVEDKTADPELPPVTPLREMNVPAIVLKPFILEHTGRRRVRDVRAQSHSRVDLGKHEPGSTYGEWGYLSAVVVHRTECDRMRRERLRMENASSWAEINRGNANVLDRRPAWLSEILPRVADGTLHVTMCLTCKPLGRYSKWVNERLALPGGREPDRALVYRHQPELTVGQQAWCWSRWFTMTPQRWQALAELIEFLDRQVNGDPGPHAGTDTDG